MQELCRHVSCTSAMVAQVCLQVEGFTSPSKESHPSSNGALLLAGFEAA